jgi:uncharacterized membrane protein
MEKKKNFRFFQDMLLEEKGGKYSTKKAWGHVVMALVCITYVLDGWDFYVINEHLFDSMLLAGVTLLGLTFIRGLFGKRSESSTTKNESENENV